LWGSKGVFTTVRVVGRSPRYIFLKEHLSQLNKSLKKQKIKFALTEKKLLELIPNQLKIKKFNHLLRIAVKQNLISISLRPRLKPSNNFQCQLVNYQRVNARVKNLHYKKILSLQKDIDLQKEEILFYSKKMILEGSTTNLIMIKNNQMIMPKGNYYKGITINYLLKKFTNKYIFKSITSSDLLSADELILIGSGKGVVKVSSIPQIKWFSSSSKMFKRLSSIYEAQLKL
jgi:branched-subunit amino acid aminotransferase/4-amino-4-deoxychorismate lyase